MNYYYFLRHLNYLEKDIVFILSILLILVFVGVLILKISKKEKDSKMLNNYLKIKYVRRKEIIGLLTSDDGVVISDIKNLLRIDITKFDSEYRDMLYHDFVKIKQDHEVNPKNWKLFVELLYLHSENKTLAQRLTK